MYEGPLSKRRMKVNLEVYKVNNGTNCFTKPRSTSNLSILLHIDIIDVQMFEPKD